ncbi:cytochrome P450 [Streptomyces sp. CAU 1734]|uniref:cytochrome P450 n=1 Tax=Streptomyces sp. CAU 1734 TaxID=3140360 RepID=UPI003261D37A
MTSPRPDVPSDGSVPAPPPGCPAHRPESGAPHRLHGPAAAADPRAVYELLRREHGPVAPVLVHGDLPAWLVLGHRENLEVMRTPSLYSRDSRRWSMFEQGRVPADSPLIPMIGWQPVCVFADGDEHARLRRAVTDGLAQFNRHGVRRYVTHHTRRLVAGFASRGEADLIGEYAERLPMLVMNQLLGMPEENGPRLVEAARDATRGGPAAPAGEDLMAQTLRTLVRRKTERPGRDLASRLIGHESGLTGDEVVDHLRLVLLAANEATVNLIANTLRLVLTDRRFRASLSGGQMTLPDALEQVLWDAPPLSVVAGRWAVGDTVLGGRRISAGDMVLLGLAAGNADPEIRPDRSAPVHGNRSHLSFSGGPHECPGQDIGRAIADTGIDTLLTLLPGLELAVSEAELVTGAARLTERLESLPVRFTPEREAVPGPELRVSAAPPVSQPLPAASPQPPAPPAVPAPRGELSRWQRVLRGR